MARAQKAMCSSCSGRIEIGESYCDHCGRPTAWASYEERIEWEVRQWRDARGRSGTSEVIQPRLARSRGSTVAVAEMDAPSPPSAVATSVDPHDEASLSEVPRESLFARLRSLARRLLDVLNARTETSNVGRSAAAAEGGDVALESVGRPTLVIVNDRPTETPEPAAPQAVVEAPPESVVVSEPVVATPEVTAPVLVAPDLEPAAAAPAEPEVPAPAATSAPSSPALRRPPRKRPNRPTNKELLQRTLTTLERMEARLHHLEEEIEEIDQAVRKAPAAALAEDDDLEPPAAAGPFGYI